MKTAHILYSVTLLTALLTTSVPAADFRPAEKTGAAIQKAIDEAFGAGGGRVVLDKAIYPSGTLYLKSNVELHVPEGAVILGADKPEAYDDVDDPRIRVRPERSTKVFIACIDGENVAITGKGVIDGKGVKFYDVNTVLWKRFYQKPPHPRPRMIEFFNCRKVRFEDITFKDSPGWTCWMRKCEDFTADGVKIDGDQKMINNDGFDIDSCRKVLIRKCNIRSGDDCIVMRSMRKEDVCEDVTVEDCVLDSACQCIRLGCPSDGTIRRGTFRRLKLLGWNGVNSDHPLRYLRKGETGSCRMQDILVSDCDIVSEGSALMFTVAEGITLAEFGNVTLRNISFKSKQPLKFIGTKASPLRGMRLENVAGTVESDVPYAISNVVGFTCDRFAVTCAPPEKH